jgi:hypothetical protein
LSDAIRERTDGPAARAFRLVMAGGLLLVLAANLPGQMSLDSVVALVEARTGIRQTWAPAVSSWLLKLFDHVLAGTGLYVTASASLLFLSLMSLVGLRGRSSWWAVLLGVAAIATPQLLIYQGIVWRDVLFANLSVAGFIMLAHAAKGWRGRVPYLPLAGALVCLALATLVRQNGLLLLVAGAIVVGWSARGKRGARLAWGLGFLIAAGALAFGINHLAQPAQVPEKLRLNSAALILQHYDVVGAKAHSPSLKMGAIGAADPAARDLLESQAASQYSPSRVDTLDLDEAYRKALWRVPDKAMNAQWIDVLTHHPGAYLLHRADVFRWTLLTPDLMKCLPVQVGVEGPPDMLKTLNVQAGQDNQDRALNAYATRFYPTPVYSHLTWALVAVAMIGLLLRRRDPADWAIIGLLGGTLAFVASFAVISVACDYRYLYLLDLAAMVSLIYVALDPPGFRKVRVSR